MKRPREESSEKLSASSEAQYKEVKALETLDAIRNGADEIDMVINVGKAKEHDYDYIEEEIAAVVKAAEGKTVKVIIETCYLTDEEKNTISHRARALKNLLEKLKLYNVAEVNNMGVKGTSLTDAEDKVEKLTEALKAYI